MRKLVFSALVLMISGLMIVGIYLRRGNAQAMNVSHNVKDLPEHGLTIITPSSPAFDTEMTALLGDAENVLKREVIAVRSFCIFLKNTSDQEIVAYKLRWDLMKSGGQVRVRYSSTISPSKLMGEEFPAGLATGGEIKPNTSRFIAWESSLEKVLYSHKNKPSELPAQAAQKLGAMLSQVGTMIGQQTESVVSVTVSIDGAFFADGTFVGPDTDNTFAEVKGYVESKRELAHLVEAKKQEGKSASEIVDQISSAYKDLDNTLGANPTTAEMKNFFMKVHVNELLKAREVTGDNHAVTQMLRPLRTRELKLRKKVK